MAADVGERVYAALARNELDLVEGLGLSKRRRCVPLTDVSDREAALYLPQTDGEAAIDPIDLSRTFVVPDDSDSRGRALRPTGELLLVERRAATPGGLADDAVTHVDQLADGLRDHFELVDSVRLQVEDDDGRATMAVSDSAFGAIDRFDHPLASLLSRGSR